MNGNVFRKSSKEAVYWCRLAAKQGFPGAEVNLGTLYYEGKGVPRDYSQTLYWMRKAADQGDAQGEYNLGVLYAYGRGVPQNLQELRRSLPRS
jgi:TPR repeat protein